MTRELKIKGRTGVFDTPSFLVTENESLKIKLVFVDEIRIGRFRLTVRHGGRKKTFTLSKNEEIELSPEWLKESAENLEFSLAFLNSTESAVIKDDYQIEPLKLERIGGNFAFVAMVQELIERCITLEERQIDFEARLKAFEEDGVPLALACGEDDEEKETEK